MDSPTRTFVEEENAFEEVDDCRRSSLLYSGNPPMLVYGHVFGVTQPPDPSSLFTKCKQHISSKTMFAKIICEPLLGQTTVVTEDTVGDICIPSVDSTC